MKIKIFQLHAILLIVCMVSFLGFSTTVLADAHETEEETAEEERGVSGWFQVDVDSLGTYFLIGASHPLGNVSLDSKIYVNSTYVDNPEEEKEKNKFVGEFAMGLSVPAVYNDNLSLFLLPMLGVGFNYANADGPYTLNPQFFAFLSADKIFLFSWTYSTIATVFDDERKNDLYTRNFVTYSLNDTIAIGPQIETYMTLGDEGELFNLNVGGRMNIGYGENNTLGIYVGYETKKGDEETGLTGRLNFTRLW